MTKSVVIVLASWSQLSLPLLTLTLMGRNHLDCDFSLPRLEEALRCCRKNSDHFQTGHNFHSELAYRCWLQNVVVNRRPLRYVADNTSSLPWQYSAIFYPVSKTV